MTRYLLASFALALSSVCMGLVAGPFNRHVPQAAIAFLSAILLFLLAVGLLWRRAAFALAAIAVYVVSGPALLANIPQTFLNTLLVMVGYPVALMLAGLGLDELLKWRSTRVRYVRTNVRTKV